MSSEPIIELSGISKSYQTGKVATPVLFDVDLQVAEGEFVAIVGTSGSGKSTLLNVIGGLDRHFRGEARVAGQRLRGLDDPTLSQFRNRTIGFVFQQFNLLEHLSCGENVALPAIFTRHSDREAADRAREALGRVGLGERYDDLAANLSGGQKQRVAIARALYNRPPILLCDEPTGNLDTLTGQQIIDLFMQLNREGITLLIVTHESRVSAAAHRLVRLEDGKLSTGDEHTTVGVDARVAAGPAAAQEAETDA